MAVLYPERLALGVPGHLFHPSWCPTGHAQLT
jgi:hypothetical protein